MQANMLGAGDGKAMKPAWDKLMKQYDGHASILVGDVDPMGGHGGV